MAHDRASSPQESISGEEVDTTQSLFSPGVIPQSLGRNDMTGGDYNSNSSYVTATREPTLLKSTEETREPVKIETEMKHNIVTWKDAKSQAQSEIKLHLYIFLDTSANTALFRLYGEIQSTDEETTSSKQVIYLFIHPEDIRFITLETTDDVPPLNTLCFSLRRSHYIVAPGVSFGRMMPEDVPLLISLDSISNSAKFNVQLNSSGMNALSKSDLEQVAFLFSPNHNIVVDKRRADPDTFFLDTSGEVASSPIPTCFISFSSPFDETLKLTPLMLGMLNSKHKNPNLHHEQSVTAPGRAPLVPQDILTRFGAISSSLGALYELLDGLNSRLERLERMTAANPGHDSVEETTDRLAEVNMLVDKGIVDFKAECEDVAKKALKELRNEINDAAEQLRSEAMKEMREAEEHTE
ncbi:hypothetical protein ACHAQJ_002514 [Trichoderma viride]